MLRLNPNPLSSPTNPPPPHPCTLSVCGPPSGEMEVIHSAETHHPNPISSLPQQEIITSIKAVRTRRGGGALSETLLQALEISTGGGVLLGELKLRYCSKLRKCVN